MKTSGIYRIDLGNGYFYIGSAVDIARREKEHRSDLKHRHHYNSIMQNCWNKYGMFEFIVLELCAISDLLVREQFHLDQHFDDPKNVNMCRTAGSTLGRAASTESRAKMSVAKKNMSAETKAKISAANKGKVNSDEARAKQSAAQTGRVFSAETLAKMSAAKKGKVHSPEARANMVAGWVLRRARAA